MIVKAQPFSTPSAGCSPAAQVPCPIGPPTPSPVCCISPSPAAASVACQPCPPGPVGPAGPAMSALVESLLAALNDKVFDLLRLLEVLTILQTISLSLQADLDAIIALGTESNAKLEEIKSKLDSEIASLSAIIASLSVLHNDNLAQGAQLDVLHVDNLAIDESITTFNESFDEVKETTNGREVIMVELTENGTLCSILDELRKIQTQLFFITDVNLK